MNATLDPSPPAAEFLTLQVHPAAQLPDAETDVLIWDDSDPAAQLGAYVGHDAHGTPVWVGAHGQTVTGVTHWAHFPVRAGA